jgi:hypothetical protein
MSRRGGEQSRIWTFVDACLWWITMGLTYVSIAILLTGRLAVVARRFVERRVRKQEPEF